MVRNDPALLATVGTHEHAGHHTRPAVVWGLIVGVFNAAAPLAFWWLNPATVHALIITLIASVYIGFAVADGRRHVIAAECTVTLLFVIVAASSVTSTAWLLVIAYFGHGLKDLWQHRHQFVAGTRWWPPFCAAVDFLVAAVIATEIVCGVNFH
jgi:hypothetical protein